MTTTAAWAANANSQRESAHQAIDQGVSVLKDNARSFARLSVAEKLGLLRTTMDRLAEVAEAWVRDGARAKGIPPEHGEEWLTGPNPTMRNLRLLVRTLEKVQGGQPILEESQVRTRPDGRVEARVFPGDAIDGALFSGFTVSQLMMPGLTAADARQKAASFYQKKDPEGGVSLILGAGNVSSIPPMDALTKMIGEGMVCVVKMNPVNEWSGPHLERAFSPFIERGFMQVVYGGAEVGSHLVNHAAIDDIHITGSNHTHDMIVWGPPGPERERRIAANDPVLKKKITSELGNVSPVAIVPANYADSELEFIARNIGAMITNNGSFNCNAAKLLITAEGWPQKKALLDRIAAVLEATPTRLAYYPGAYSRYERLTQGREVQKIGQGDERRLPWTLIRNVDSSKKDDPIFSTEPFCAILSETTVPGTDPAEFIRNVTSFMNDTLWGTLNAMIVLPPALEASQSVGAELDKAILDLRYGSVTINHWPGLVYGMVIPAWGGHPSATLANIQSGLGWVHNTNLLEGIEKTVLRGPLKVFPKPVWFADNRRVEAVGRRLFQMEHHPSWLKVPGIVLQALQG